MAGFVGQVEKALAKKKAATSALAATIPAFTNSPANL